WDSPNSAGIVIDAVRCAKLGLDRGLKGALIAPSSYFKKSPPVQIPDDVARELFEEYIKAPKAVEARMRVNAPRLRGEAAPAAAKRTKAATNGALPANGNGTAKPAAKKPRRRTAPAR